MLRKLAMDSASVDTTWAFIRMIEHWNKSEWWRPFKIHCMHTFEGRLITVSGKVSTQGRFRGCNRRFWIHNDRTRTTGKRLYFHCTRVPIYQVVLETFVPKPNSLKRLVPDHINRNSMDNRLSNLRWLSLKLNQLNKSNYFDANNNLKSGVGVEVYRIKRGLRYRARISINSVKLALGTYDTMEEADAIYRRAWRDSFEIFE